MTFPGNYREVSAANLYILADTPGTNFLVEAPGVGFSAPGSASPGSPATVFLPELLAIQSNETVEQKGIRVSAGNPVTVIFRSPVPPSTTDDAYLALPVAALGNNAAMVLGFREDVSDIGASPTEAPSQFTLVATQDGTHITVVPVAKASRVVLPARQSASHSRKVRHGSIAVAIKVRIPAPWSPPTNPLRFSEAIDAQTCLRAQGFVTTW